MDLVLERLPNFCDFYRNIGLLQVDYRKLGQKTSFAKQPTTKALSAKFVPKGRNQEHTTYNGHPESSRDVQQPPVVVQDKTHVGNKDNNFSVLQDVGQNVPPDVNLNQENLIDNFDRQVTLNAETVNPNDMNQQQVPLQENSGMQNVVTSVQDEVQGEEVIVMELFS